MKFICTKKKKKKKEKHLLATKIRFMSYEYIFNFYSLVIVLQFFSLIKYNFGQHLKNYRQLKEWIGTLRLKSNNSFLKVLGNKLKQLLKNIHQTDENMDKIIINNFCGVIIVKFKKQIASSLISICFWIVNFIFLCDGTLILTIRIILKFSLKIKSRIIPCRYIVTKTK